MRQKEPFSANPNAVAHAGIFDQAENFLRAMTLRYLLALLLLAALSSAAYVLLDHGISKQQTSAAVVNISGRQRMLTQRIALFSLRLANSDDPARSGAIRLKLQEYVELVESSHQGLIAGDADLNLPGNPSDKVKEIYFHPPYMLDAKLRQFIAEARLIAASEHGTLSMDNPHLSNLLAAADDELLRALDLVVRQYQTESEEDIAHLRLLEMLVIGATLLLLIVVAVFIFRPLTRRIKDEVSSILAVEQDLAEKNVELSARSSLDRLFASIISVFGSTMDQQAALKAMFSQLQAVLPLGSGAFYAFDEWEGMLTLGACYNTEASIRQSIPQGEGLVGQVACDKTPLVLTGIDEYPSMIDAGIYSIRPHSVIALPVLMQDKLLGVLVLATTGRIDTLTQGFLEKVSFQLGTSLQNLKQYSDLKALSIQLQQRGEEISLKNQELQKANKMKSEFLANVSHELRTPLNAIIGFSELMKDGLLGELEDKQQECVTEIYNSGKHLLSLINDILDLSKIEAGKMELHEERVVVSELIRNSQRTVNDSAHKKNIKLSLELEDKINTAYTDQKKLKQILYNLLSNAVKFTPNGGTVKLAATISDADTIQSACSADNVYTPASLRLSRESSYLAVRVEDTGIGIERTDLESIFRPFEQVDSSLARKYEGTGLGLVITKRLAEFLGGGVGVSSRPGVGSCFYAWIPYHTERSLESLMPQTAQGYQPDADATSSVMCQAGSTDQAGSPDVLIVEDDDLCSDLFQVQLSGCGLTVKRTSCAEEAFEIMQRQRPRLIVLDIVLPGMDGWEFLLKKQAQRDLASIPVVIVSMAACEKKGFSLGASMVLQKPVEREQLIETVNAIVSAPAGVGAESGILVVDDDPKSVEIVMTYLKEGGYTPISAYGGQEGIDQAVRHKPGLIILDLMMPEVSGFDVVNALKQQQDTAHIPIVILTAKVITEEDRAMLNGGVRKIVQKSEFKAAGFLDEVKRAMRQP